MSLRSGYKYNATGGARNTGAATGYWRQIKVPAPRRWCHHIINELDVVAVLMMNLPDTFGWPGVRLMAKGCVRSLTAWSCVAASNTLIP